MTYIKQVTMSGFKSFGNRTVSVKLAKGFTCIIGPNGNGKSNVIDALCFALGRMSKKTMRAKSLTDLIFAGSKTKKPASRAEVEIAFDNRNREFPVDSDEYRISRWVKSKGTSGYKIQGKKSTRDSILNALAQANIDPDGSNQFILQGKIVELTHMNTNNRRIFIETLIGLEKYDQMKNQTMKELEKADKDLGQFEAIFKEVSAQLKKVEKEKNDALRWKELDNAVNLANAQLIALKIHKLREEEEEVLADIEETQIIVEELEGKITRQKEKIEAESLFLKSIEEDLAVQEENKSKLDETLSQNKAELSAKQATLQASKENLEKLHQQKQKLEELQDKLEDGQTYDDLLGITTKEIEAITEKITNTSSKIEEAVSEQKKREELIAEINNQKAAINKEISKVEQEISKNNTENNLLEKSIKKNSKKLTKLETELKKLKKEGESVEEAIAKATKESEEISSKIAGLKTNIEELKKKQKDLDKEIKKTEKERDKANKHLADIQAAISSANAEVNLFNNRIAELEENKNNMQKEYDRLTKGKSVEEQIKKLKETEKGLMADIKKAKDELSKANEEQKRSQGKKESIEVKRRSLESEISDIEKRLSGLKVEIKNASSELKTAEREQTNSNSIKKNLEKELIDFTASKQKLDKNLENVTKKIEKLQKDRENLQKRIDKKEAEQEESSGELETVMANLTELMQNIDRSAGDIKSDIQNTSQVAIDEAGSVFKSYVMDISDMLSSIEEIANLEDPNDIKEQILFVVETLKLLIENSDESISQLNQTVKSASDEALEESTQNFDGFIQDFTTKFDSIRLALKAAAVSDTSELYKSLDNLNNEIQKQNNELATLNNQLTKLNSQIEQNEKDTKQNNKILADLNKKINENTAKMEKGNKESDEKAKNVETNQGEIEKLNTQLDEIKKFSDDFWKNNKDLQAQIDTKSEELTQAQADLSDLKGVQRILDDIKKAEEEKVKVSNDIEKKNTEIKDLTNSTDKAKVAVEDIEKKIEEIKNERDSAEEQRNEIQKQIDEENENLKKAIDQLRKLENVQKIITDIETLTKENEESAEKIEVNKTTIEELNTQVKKHEEEIAEKNKEIEKIQAERKDLEQQEKELRNNNKESNVEKHSLEKKLDKQQQMKARALEIIGLEKEIEQTNDLITEIEDKIAQLSETISATEAERSEKLEQIADLQSQKSQSWEKEKTLRDELGDINAENSKQSAKMNNLESRKIVIEERIDELFEKSKDYGTLPPVTDDLSEPGLNQAINKATNEKKALEPVNLKSIEEYDVVKERWDEIDMRRQTLQRERKAILDSIDRIELEKTRNFMKAYHEINRVFSSVFQKLSPGGSAKMILENPAHPFEGGITIEARPRGKKISSLNILSGGEKTLVALSFIFAVQNFYPAPFYIMDEIDAALDGPNVYRTSMVIKEYADQSQFLVISHREENITNAERIYGVAMNDGITDIFTVDLEEEKQRDDFDSETEGFEKDDDDDTPIVTEIED
jgi:chromosome segregation protein